eukprot:3895339-Prymnesium_polylepis.1
MLLDAGNRDVVISLGGEWQALSESESRHRALLLQADAALRNADAALSRERERAAALQQALEHAGGVAASAMKNALELEVSEARVRRASEFAAAGCESLQRELACAEAELSEQFEAAAA